MNKKKSIGFYGGSFDPIHFGHLNLAIQLKEYHNLDEIWISPATISPFKTEESIACHHRFQMISLAIEDIPGFRVIDHEIRRKGPSFTIDTMKQLTQEYGVDHHFFLLLGSDALEQLHLWKEIETLINLAPPLIGKRSLSEPSFSGSIKLQNAIKQGLTPSSVMEIESTNIRKRLSTNKCCSHLIPAKVLDYIYQNQLYFYSDE